MSTEVTPDLLRTVLAAWEGGSASDAYARNELNQWAKSLEREQRPLPTEPGWYPTIVVERGGESCTGALLRDDGNWATPRPVVHSYGHVTSADYGLTIRWAEQDGKTPGQTAFNAVVGTGTWSTVLQSVRDTYEREAAAVLAAHGTPTLTPVGEHPEPGTRGLLPVRFVGEWGWIDVDTGRQVRLLGPYPSTILADPRPGGAL